MSTIVKATALKDLQSRLEKEKATLKVAEREMKEVKDRISGCHHKINKIKKEIQEYSEKEGLVMSEHSILQYQRRVELLSPEDVIEKVVTEKLKTMYGVLGDGTFPLDDGVHSAVIKNNHIITII